MTFPHYTVSLSGRRALAFAVALLVLGAMIGAAIAAGYITHCDSDEMWSWYAHMCVLRCPGVGCT